MGEKIINKVEATVEAPELELPQLDAETVLREVIKKEIILKIRENFKKRNLIEEPPTGEDKPEKKSVLEFEYLRHNLLLSDILEKVTERGIFGTIKKDWRIITDEIQKELSQLAPESQAAIEKAIEGMFEKKRKIEEYLKSHKPDEIFSDLIGDDKKHRPEGTVSAKTLGDILTVYLPNELDFSKVYRQSVSVSEGDIEDSSRVGGFADKRQFGKLGDTDIIVFPGPVYKSALSHEVAHRISDRLFEEDAPQIKKAERSEYSEPRKLLDSIFDFWVSIKLKDELWNQALSGLMHYDKSPGINVEKILSKHVDYSFFQGKGELYDYPAQNRLEVMTKLQELFPEESYKSLEGLYQDYSRRYFEFAVRQVDFIKKQMSELKIQWMRYDFLNLLRFEDIRKWHRIPRFLETIGKNFNVLKEKWGFEPKSIETEMVLNGKISNSKDELYDYELDSMEALMKADDTTRAFVLLQWANYTSNLK